MWVASSRRHYTIPRRSNRQQTGLYNYSPMSEHQRTRVAGVIAALLGALVFALLLVTVYARQSEMNIRVDVDLPPLARGFYPAEGAEDSMFAWTRQKAELSVPGL